MTTPGPHLSRPEEIGLARILVLVGNALLLVWGLADGWRITHLVGPFVLESIVVGLFALRHITRGTIRATPYRINGGDLTRARWPRIAMGLRALNFFLIGVFVVGLFAMFIALMQPVALPQPGDRGNLLRVLGVLAILIMLVHRHYLHYRQQVRLDDAIGMDLARVAQTYRQTLVSWVGLALLTLIATVFTLGWLGDLIEAIAGADWRHLVDSVLLVAAIAAKTRYEWWLERPVHPGGDPDGFAGRPRHGDQRQ